MSKTRILSKKFALLVLACAMLVSAVMGVAFMKPVNAEPTVSYDLFEVTGGGSVEYAATGVQVNNPNFTPGTFEGFYSNTIEPNLLKVTLDSVESKFTFKNAINLKHNSAIRIAPVWEEGVTNLVSEEIEFFITLTDAEDETNTVTIRQKLIEGSYYALAGHSGMGSVLVGNLYGTPQSTANGPVKYGSYVSLASLNLLKEYTINSKGLVTAAHLDDATLEIIGGPSTIADFKDVNYVGSNTWNGFTGDEVYVSVTSSEPHSFAISKIGKYDLTKADSLAYGGAGVEGEEEIIEEPPVPEVESYDYFTVKGVGSVKYDRVKLFYGTDRPFTTSANIEALVANLDPGATVEFTKPITFNGSALTSFISVGFADDEAQNSSSFENMAFTIKITNVNDANDYVTIHSKVQYGDQYTVNADFSNRVNALGATNVRLGLWGGMLKDYASQNGKIIGRNYVYNEEDGFYCDSTTGGGDIVSLYNAGWGMFGTSTQVYVSVTAHQASSLVIKSIGEYDLTDVESPAYDVKPVAEVESYDYFTVSGSGSVKYDRAQVFMGENRPFTNAAKIETLVANLGQNETMTFTKPVTFNGSALTSFMGVGFISEDAESSSDFENMAFTIKITNADDANDYVTIYSKVQYGDQYTVTADFSNRTDALAATNVRLGLWGGMIKDYASQNGKIIGRNYVYNEEGFQCGPTTGGADIVSLYNAGWGMFGSSNKVIVSLTAHQASSFVITNIGEYDLTDVESPAYDALPTVEEACDGLLTMGEGAEVRYDFDGYTGIRFTTNIVSAKKADLDNLLAKGIIDSYSFGTIITPLDYLTHYSIDNPTHATLDENYYYDIASSYEGGSFFNGALVKIKASNYDRDWIARGYVKVVIDEVETFYYADYNADNARSIYELAKADYALYEAEEILLLEEDVEFLETVINYVEAD